MRSRDPIKKWFEEYSGHRDLPLHRPGATFTIKRSKKSEENYYRRKIAERVDRFKQNKLW